MSEHTEPASGGLLLPDWLARRAEANPQRVALRCGPVCWTYPELHRRAGVAAQWLAELGARPGGRVALLLRNGPAYAALVHAAPRARVILVLLNTRLAPPELAWQLTDCGARLLVYDAANASAAQALGAFVPGLRAADVAEMPAELPVPDAAPEIDLSAVHSIIYTSGTTGRPKGAALTYGNYWWSAIGSALNLGLHVNDRWLAVLPLFHVGGLSILLRAVIYGITAVVHEAFDPAEVNRAIDEDSVTMVSVVSTMLRRMLDKRGERPYPPTLRCVLLGGGPAPLSLLEECARRGVPVVQTYGLTEAASQVATLAPEDALRKLGSAGKPLLPVELRIECDGRPATPGEVGEILVRGPTISPGYITPDGGIQPAGRDGWLHTGDLGYLDEEGYLYVVDRRDDLIISGGENIYPAEVEAVLQAHPAVAEAGVTGMPDPRWGRVPVAFVRLHPGAAPGEAELIAHCAARLARYKVPVRIWVVDELPRNAAGKLLRRVLRERCEAMARES